MPRDLLREITTSDETSSSSAAQRSRIRIVLSGSLMKKTVKTASLWIFEKFGVKGLGAFNPTERIVRSGVGY